jgi:hypothetical protein
MERPIESAWEAVSGVAALACCTIPPLCSGTLARDRCAHFAQTLRIGKVQMTLPMPERRVNAAEPGGLQFILHAPFRARPQVAALKLNS